MSAQQSGIGSVMATALDAPPLSVELIENRPQESYSHRILSLIRTNPLFNPKLKKDGSISEHDTLVMATTLLSASDERIRELEFRNAFLEKKNNVLNGPMFGPRSVKSDDATVPQEESNWFLQYLTLRNFLSASVLLIAALWAFFTWYSADKGAQLSEALSKAAASDRTADQAVKEREQFQKDSEYWKKNAADYKKLADDKEIARSTAAADTASQKSRADTLNQQLTLAQTQNKQLLEKLTAPPPVALKPANGPPSSTNPRN